MTSPLLHVLSADAPVSIQDLGRRHATHFGFTESGAMDIKAMMWANRLLDREFNAPVFEITLGQFAVEFLADCQIAITGADLNAKLNDRPILPWRSVHVAQDSRLQFGLPTTGLRAYLAIDADLDVPRRFASAATSDREPQGSSQMTAGTVIGASRIQPPGVARQTPTRFVPDYSAPLTLDLIPGYQYDQFSTDQIEQFLSADYQITPNSNRMAYALAGPKVEHDIEQMFSEGIAYGAVQIPPDGQPVVLLNERQTMGGYPKIGCITRLSGGALSQRMAPTKIRIQRVDSSYSRAELSATFNFFMS